MTVKGKANVSKVREIISRRTNSERTTDFCQTDPAYIQMTKKRLRVQITKQLLKMFQTFNQRQFENIVTGDGKLVHYFEPVRTIFKPKYGKFYTLEGL